MQLDKVIPFGRTLDEYRHMFALSEKDLEKSLLGVADGPASVNAELSALGKRIISVDPLYHFSADEIVQQFQKVKDSVFAQVEASMDGWVWTYHKSLAQLRARRNSAMQLFASDFPEGVLTGRYRIGELPRLDFADRQFDLALCSHFLFLYSELLPLAFHRDSVLELIRVAEEVRIFPLLTLAQQLSPHLQPVLDELEENGHTCSIEKVDYEFQKGGNHMLRIRRNQKGTAMNEENQMNRRGHP